MSKDKENYSKAANLSTNKGQNQQNKGPFWEVKKERMNTYGNDQEDWEKEGFWNNKMSCYLNLATKINEKVLNVSNTGSITPIVGF